MHKNEARIAVIKIDAESHDLDVLIGAEQVLMRHRPVVFLEVLLGADEDALIRILQSCRYIDIPLKPGSVPLGGCPPDGNPVRHDTVKHHTDAWNHMWLPIETDGAGLGVGQH